MPHVMERCVFNSLLYYNCRIGLYSGDMTKLMEDLSVLKPTVFVSVPRIFNKIYDKLTSKMDNQNSIVKSLVSSAV